MLLATLVNELMRMTQNAALNLLLVAMHMY